MADTLIPTSERDQSLGGLKDGEYKYASFIYPQNLAAPNSGYPHYVVFFINQTNNTQFTTRNVGNRAPTDLPTVNQNIQRVTGSAQTPSTSSNATGAIANLKQPISRVSTAIVLYYPHEIQLQQQAQWSPAETGSAGAMMEAFQNGKSVVDTAGWWWLGKAGERGAEYLSRMTNMNLKDVISRAGRVAINPHQEVLYNGQSFRQFTFNYRFMPQSPEESDLVDNIVKAFRFYAAPELLQSAQSRFFIYPAEFDIKFYSHGEENRYLNRITTSALTDIQLNYTGSSAGWAGFRPTGRNDKTGSPPVALDLTLTFTEVAIITKKEILNGY